MYACNGILFNHESPLRGETFVTRKITRAVAAIVLGKQDCLYLGNLDAKRDWGHAKDYVEGMWLMLQQDKPEDFVLATGITTTIREFVKMSFEELGISLEFSGIGVDEKAFVKECKNANYTLPIGKMVVSVDLKYFRPTEVDLLIGDPSKANHHLKWYPKYNLKSLCEEMIMKDISLTMDLT
jgi:GDPmannose 4,6-dehydratase